VDEVQVHVVQAESLKRCLERALALSSPGFWIQSLVVTNNSLRGMPLLAMARPTASSFS
jgi:hypothetical protein